MSTLPNLDWLRTFEAAARLQSFSAAAKELHLTQAGVSQQIRKLEAQLGVSLFKRLPRSIELTSQGDAYLPHVRQALSTIVQGTSDLFFSKRLQKLTLAAPASFTSLWLAPRLPLIKQALPQLHLSLFSIHRHTDYDGLDADIEIRFGSGNYPDAEQQLLFEEVLSPLCAPDLVKSTPTGQWHSLPKLALTGPRSGWATWSQLTGDPIGAQAPFRFDSLMVAQQAAQSGAGVLLGSLPLLSEMVDRGWLIRLSKVELKTSEGYWLISKNKHRFRPGTDDLARLIGRLASV